MTQDLYFQIPDKIFERDGPFEEFKQDGAIVTVELDDGKKYSGVLVLYPNYIISIKGYNSLPFDPNKIIKVYQTETDLITRSESSWVFYPHP